MVVGAMRSTVRATVVALGVAAVATLALVPTTPAGAAGVTTHAWMAATAVDQVTNPQLKALLKANLPYVRTGAHFPDSGYALTNKYGEEAHWQRFVDAMVAQIKSRTDCPDLTAPSGPCAPLIAFTLGVAAHGMGDEVWDWLFEPNSAQRNEYYTPADLGSYATTSGAELQMDLVAVGAYHQPTTKTLPFPDHADIIAAFGRAGFTDVDEGQLDLGQVAMDVLHNAEGGWAPTHLAAVEKAMPWMAHNMITAPGGVDFAATAIAGYWGSMWGELLGDQPPTSVSITYPAADQRRIPATGWEVAHNPGASPGNGPADTRIAAVLTSSRPYVTPSNPTVSNLLPAGSMTLTERDSGDPVPIADGYPKSAPYGSDSGEHLIAIQPAGDLAPCTWYHVAVTSSLVDARDQAVVPYAWDFRTGTDGDGDRCADDPYNADEKFARAVTDDLLARPATETELREVDTTFALGRTRSAYTADQLGSIEERTKLVADGFQAYLGRSVDPGGRTYWASKLASITLPEFHARLLASDEVYRKAGGTNAGYVAALYPLVQGRPVDASGAAYWTKKLDAGLSRHALAKRLLTSHEAAGKTVTGAYQSLLHRAADASGLAHWTRVVEAGADPRTLWKSLILSPEYDRHAQAA